VKSAGLAGSRRSLQVVKEFIARVRVRAVGAEVSEALNPAQQVIKIVHEELLATLGTAAPLDLSGSTPHIVMLVGLQGSGKTTTAASWRYACVARATDQCW